MRVQLRLELSRGAMRGSSAIVAGAAVALEHWDAAFVHLLVR